VLELLSTYIYTLSIVRICLLAASIVAAFAFSMVFYKEMKKRNDNESVETTLIATLVFCLVVLIISLAMSSLVVNAICPQASAAHMLIGKL